MTETPSAAGTVPSVRAALQLMPPALVFQDVVPLNDDDAAAMLESLIANPMHFTDLAHKDPGTFKLRSMQYAVLAAHGTKGQMKEALNAVKLMAPAAVAAKLPELKQSLIDTLEVLPPDNIVARHVLAKLKAPKGYVVQSDGVWAVKDSEDGERDYTNVCAAPVFIAGLAYNPITKDHMVSLVFRTTRGWHCRTFAQGALAVSKSTEMLSSAGIEVDGNNIKSFIRYMSRFRQVNRNNLPDYLITESMGWLNNSIFVLPGNIIVPAGAENTQVLFEPDPGLHAVTASVHTSGTWEDAKALYGHISQYPWMCIGTWASLGSVVLDMLKVCDVEPFTMDIGGPTGTAKTQMLRWMASIWGHPIKYSCSWAHTNLLLEQHAHLRGSLPLLLDELKLRLHRKEGLKEAQQMVYSIQNGHGRSGSTKDRRAQRALSWWSAAASSNETPLVKMAKDAAGLRARVVPVITPVFGQYSQKAHDDINHLKNNMARTFGHFGPRFAAAMVGIRADPAWCKLIEDYYWQQKQNFVTWWGGGSAVDRCCVYLAVISTTQWLFHHIFQAEGIGAPACGEAAILAKFAEAARVVGHHAADAERQLIAVGRFLLNRPGDVFGLSTSGVPHVIYAAWPLSKRSPSLIITTHGLRAFAAQSVDMGVDAQTLVNLWGQKGFIIPPKEDSENALNIARTGDWYSNSVINKTAKSRAGGMDTFASVSGWPIRWDITHQLFTVQDLIDPS